MSWVAVAIGGSAVLGAGAGIYGANKAAQTAKDAQRNLPQEINGILGLTPQANAAGLATRQQYDPAYAALGNANLRNGLMGEFNVSKFAQANPEAWQSFQDEQAAGGLQGWTPEQYAKAVFGDDTSKLDAYRTGGFNDTLATTQAAQDRANAASSTFQRGANLSDMEALAPRADALRRSLNPEYYAALNRLDTPTEGEQLLGGYARSLANPDSIEASLTKQAQDDLALGSDLSAEEQRNATASSRAAYSARGLGDSNSALAGEVLNLDAARRARLDSRRTFATGIENLRLGRIGQGGGLAGNLASLTTGRNATAAQLRQAGMFDPSSVLGTVDNRLNSTASLGMAQQQFTGTPDYLSQLLGYGSDVNSSNSNAIAAGGIGAANAYSAIGGGLLSASGSLGAASIMKGAK